MDGLLSQSRVLNSSVFGVSGNDILFEAGTMVLLQSADTQRWTNSPHTDPRALKKADIKKTGEYRISFDLKRGVNFTTARGQIYKNGVEYGTLRENNTETYVTFTEDLEFNRGDEVAIYIWSSSLTAYIRNFRIYVNLGDNAIPEITFDANA